MSISLILKRGNCEAYHSSSPEPESSGDAHCSRFDKFPGCAPDLLVDRQVPTNLANGSGEAHAPARPGAVVPPAPADAVLLDPVEDRPCVVAGVFRTTRGGDDALQVGDVQPDGVVLLPACGDGPRGDEVDVVLVQDGRAHHRDVIEKPDGGSLGSLRDGQSIFEGPSMADGIPQLKGGGDQAVAADQAVEAEVDLPGLQPVVAVGQVDHGVGLDVHDHAQVVQDQARVVQADLVALVAAAIGLADSLLLDRDDDPPGRHEGFQGLEGGHELVARGKGCHGPAGSDGRGLRGGLQDRESSEGRVGSHGDDAAEGGVEEFFDHVSASEGLGRVPGEFLGDAPEPLGRFGRIPFRGFELLEQGVDFAKLRGAEGEDLEAAKGHGAAVQGELSCGIGVPELEVQLDVGLALVDQFRCPGDEELHCPHSKVGTGFVVQGPHGNLGVGVGK